MVGVKSRHNRCPGGRSRLRDLRSSDANPSSWICLAQRCVHLFPSRFPTRDTSQTLPLRVRTLTGRALTRQLTTRRAGPPQSRSWPQRGALEATPWRSKPGGGASRRATQAAALRDAEDRLRATRQKLAEAVRRQPAPGAKLAVEQVPAVVHDIAALSETDPLETRRALAEAGEPHGAAEDPDLRVSGGTGNATSAVTSSRPVDQAHRAVAFSPALPPVGATRSTPADEQPLLRHGHPRLRPKLETPSRTSAAASFDRAMLGRRTIKKSWHGRLHRRHSETSAPSK